MSSDKDKVRQQLQEERDRVDALQREIEHNRLEEEAKKNALILDEESSITPSQTQNSTAQFKPKPSETAKDDWKKILEDYMELYPDSPVKDDTLIFPSQQDAIDFFTEQATIDPPRKFFMSEYDRVGGKPTGFNVFSCGDGALYKGTFQEIQADLQAALKKNPNDANLKEGLELVSKYVNPAQNFKERLHDAKEEAPQESIEENKAPNPLSTRPM